MMKLQTRISLGVVLGVALILSGLVTATAGKKNKGGGKGGDGDNQKDNKILDQYIVEVTDKANIASLANEYDVVVQYYFENTVRGFAGIMNAGKANDIIDEPCVLSIVQNRWQLAPSSEPGGGACGPEGDWVPDGVLRIGAAPSAGLGFTGQGIGVAVVDTGLDFYHPDLQPIGSASFSAFGGSAQDVVGHGTHVGGIIAARSNNMGVVGVAPEATLYAVKVIDDYGNGSDATVMAGLEWIAQNAFMVNPPIKVVNLSISRVGNVNDNPMLHAAVNSLVNMGITVVAAAGNFAMAEVTQIVPATYPEVIAVASTTAKSSNTVPADTASKFTTDGMFWNGMGVTISAPGENQEIITGNGNINSTGLLSTAVGGGEAKMHGTSMAAAHVSGVVALMQEKGMSMLYPEQIRSYIVLGADNPWAPYDSPSSSYTFDGDLEGILNAPGALSQFGNY